MRFCRVAIVVSRPSEPSTTRSGAGCRSAASIVALRILLGSQAQRPLLPVVPWVRVLSSVTSHPCGEVVGCCGVGEPCSCRPVMGSELFAVSVAGLRSMMVTAQGR